MSKIIRYCKLNEEHYGPNAFDVSRPNIFGNPYTHIKNRETKAQVKVKTRDEAIALYDPYFDNMLKDDSEVGERFREEWDRMYEAYKTYDEIYLGCFCNLSETCHSEVIKKKLIQRSMKEKLSKIKAERHGIKDTNVSSS
jgi:hypothetical protein